MPPKKLPTVHRYVALVDTPDNRWLMESERTRDEIYEELSAADSSLRLARVGTSGALEWYTLVRWSCDLRLLTWDEHVASKSKATVQGMEPWADALPGAPKLPDAETLESVRPPPNDPGESIEPDARELEIRQLVAQQSGDDATKGRKGDKSAKSTAVLQALSRMPDGLSLEELARISYGSLHDARSKMNCRGLLGYMEAQRKVRRTQDRKWAITRDGMKTLQQRTKAVAA